MGQVSSISPVDQRRIDLPEEHDRAFHYRIEEIAPQPAGGGGLQFLIALLQNLNPPPQANPLLNAIQVVPPPLLNAVPIIPPPQNMNPPPQNPIIQNAQPRPESPARARLIALLFAGMAIMGGVGGAALARNIAHAIHIPRDQADGLGIFLGFFNRGSRCDRFLGEPL